MKNRRGYVSCPLISQGETEIPLDLLLPLGVSETRKSLSWGSDRSSPFGQPSQVRLFPMWLRRLSRKLRRSDAFPLVPLPPVHLSSITFPASRPPQHFFVVLSIQQTTASLPRFSKSQQNLLP
jgi:hypothetical protein